MAAANFSILKNTTIDAIFKVVASSGNSNSTTFIPASGFLLAGQQTQTLPVQLGIREIRFNAPGGIAIYRGTGQTVAESNLIFAGSGNVVMNNTSSWIGDYSNLTGDFTIVLSTYGTMYMQLAKLAGYENTWKPEQLGQYAG